VSVVSENAGEADFDPSQHEERKVAMRQSQDIKRREFLARTCDACLVGFMGLVTTHWSASAAKGAVATARREGRCIMLDEVTADVFVEHLGSPFRIHNDGGLPLVVHLIEATPLTPPAKNGSAPSKREPCSIIFRGPLEPVLPQQIYRIEHESLGRLDLFLVPLGPDAKGMRYEAVFN